MVDVPKQIDAVTRTLRGGELDGEPTHVQTIAQEYPAGIEDVWDATTTAERIARWFLPVDGDLRLGGRFQLQGQAGGEVLACDPPASGRASYRVTWEFGGSVSWVTVRLTEQGEERTLFELEHTAKVGDLPPGMWEQFGPGATGVGWDQALLGLALHFRTQDAVVTPEEGAAWALSDEGKQFTRAAADRWAEAQITAGGDPEAARRSADATYGFYTGETGES